MKAFVRNTNLLLRRGLNCRL